MTKEKDGTPLQRIAAKLRVNQWQVNICEDVRVFHKSVMWPTRYPGAIFVCSFPTCSDVIPGIVGGQQGFMPVLFRLSEKTKAPIGWLQS
jgi:hypothetical protein